MITCATGGASGGLAGAYLKKPESEYRQTSANIQSASHTEILTLPFSMTLASPVASPALSASPAQPSIFQSRYEPKMLGSWCLLLSGLIWLKVEVYGVRFLCPAFLSDRPLPGRRRHPGARVYFSTV